MKNYLILFAVIFSTNSFAQLTEDECIKKWDMILETESIPDLYQSFINKCDDELKSEIRRVISTNRDLGYTGARQIMFSTLDNVDGEVCAVYAGTCIRTTGIPNGSVMNCEHSWPQSMGAVGIAKSDLHHLYPEMADMNSRRSNFPFCEVDKYSYEGYGNYLGYSSKGTRCFEPNDNHKGDLSRSMLYFSVRYNKVLDNEQEGFFKKWTKEDVVSEKEVLRNDGIEEVQYNRNPFVDLPALIDLITDF